MTRVEEGGKDEEEKEKERKVKTEKASSFKQRGGRPARLHYCTI